MDDYISRQAALKEAYPILVDGDGMLDVVQVETLIGLPSVDVQPVRHGRWIEVDDAYNRISGRCSECGWEAHLYEDDVVGMPYCPNCGTRMKGTNER